MNYFGRPWNADACAAATQVETPIGELCGQCDEPVVAGERGFIFGHSTLGEEGQFVSVMRPVHVECHLRGTISHVLGVCPCSGYEPTRETAREVWRRSGLAD